MKKISKNKIKQFAKKLNVNLKVVSLETLQIGVGVELEHGYTNPKTNVTNDDLIKTIKIALAHIEEYPDYYDRLLKMESKAYKYWHSKKKPNIWLD